MHVLLTGAGGFIGAHTLEHLLVHTDWRITATDSFRHRGKTDRIAGVLATHPGDRERVAVLTHDLTAPWSEQAVHSLGRVDHVVNMASLSHVDASLAHPAPFVRNNLDVALNMLELARELCPATFVQVSTDEVYGPAPDGTRHAEWSPIVPSNPYAASKAAQEAAAISYWRAYGVPLVLTNTMNNIGERQDPEKFVPMLISRIAAGQEVTIHGRRGAIGSRYYLHARNHADAILHILRHLPPTAYRDGADGEGGRPDRYNVVGEQELDNLQLAQLVAQAVGKRLRYRLTDFHATRPGHDRRYALDGSKLAATGWTAPVPLLESLQRTVAWTLEHQAWMLPSRPVAA